ncbi:MBL fold metallo-hydrolase [Sphingomonas sp. 7/4-4]|uniref:ComEC/Rec2 family competence protein n=1 Tax=Sphingomonas sp. 7/4-4 TaxID=3018446 RepID=UPI0022F38DA6|nr:MBL fold metallo-hydrolase [Sphingomonas sp. 7/4-4]WBY08145.1 MBL fold metallo-hydrolase [Sphingomonas sp. 7/4-4]
MFVTHTHVDHNRGLRRVAETFHVRNYVHNGILTGSGRVGARWMVDHAGDFSPAVTLTAVKSTDIGPNGLTNDRIDPPLPCAGVDPKIRVLSGSWDENPGWNDGDFDNGNNHSLAIRVDYDRASFLFTGDLEDGAIDTLIERYAGNRLLDTQVYAVGHHGSYNGTTPELLGAITPDIAVISMGPSTVHAQWTAWAYGHPRKSAVTMLDDAISRHRVGAGTCSSPPAPRPLRAIRCMTLSTRPAGTATFASMPGPTAI